MKNEVKIQINSREALDRLIGDDPILKTEIQKAVLGNFVKLHIKPLVTEELNKDMIKEVMSEVFENPDSYHMKLSGRAKNLIKTEMQDSMRVLIKNLVSESLVDKKKYIEEYTISYVVDDLTVELRKIVAKRINEKLDEEIRETASKVLKESMKN